MSRRLLTLMLVSMCGVAWAQTPPDDLALAEVAPPGSFNAPLAVRHAPDGSGRVFVVQKGGEIGVIRDGVLLDDPLLDIAVNTNSESGLLGLAFHPDYDGTGERRFYVSYTRTTPGAPQAIAEFRTLAGNPDVVEPGSRREVIEVPDLAGNHNGGDIAFGPDGYLYWSMGDGGPQNDPNGFAQCLWKKPADGNPSNCAPGEGTEYYLLGKILRIDPTQTTASATAEGYRKFNRPFRPVCAVAGGGASGRLR